VYRDQGEETAKNLLERREVHELDIPWLSQEKSNSELRGKGHRKEPLKGDLFWGWRGGDFEKFCVKKERKERFTSNIERI